MSDRQLQRDLAHYRAMANDARNSGDLGAARLWDNLAGEIERWLNRWHPDELETP